MAQVTNESAYWNRIGYVEIEDRQGQWVKYGGIIDSLDFKFEGKVVGSVTPEFTVGILGLSMDTINDLTVWNPAESTKARRGIRVYAGYQKDGIANPLFNGFIFEALPTNPPEMWLNFKCLMNINGERPITEKEWFEDAEIRRIFQAIGDRWGMLTRWDAVKTGAKTKGNFIISGKTPQMLVDEFSHKFNVIIYAEHGILVCQDREPWTKEPKDTQKLSMATGLLGVSGLQPAGATFTRRLDDTNKIFSWVELESELVPKANGMYQVIEKTHKGHFRGEEWVTILRTIRYNKV